MKVAHCRKKTVCIEFFCQRLGLLVNPAENIRQEPATLMFFKFQNIFKLNSCFFASCFKEKSVAYRPQNRQ
jgi:hypothetical protein